MRWVTKRPLTTQFRRMVLSPVPFIKAIMSGHQQVRPGAKPGSIRRPFRWDEPGYGWKPRKLSCALAALQYPSVEFANYFQHYVSGLSEPKHRRGASRQPCEGTPGERQTQI